MDKYTFDSKRWRNDCKKAMMRKGYSFREMELGTGMSFSTIHRTLIGKRDVKMQEFITISAKLGLEAIVYFDVDEVQLRMF